MSLGRTAWIIDWPIDAIFFFESPGKSNFKNKCNEFGINDKDFSSSTSDDDG